MALTSEKEVLHANGSAAEDGSHAQRNSLHRIPAAPCVSSAR